MQLLAASFIPLFSCPLLSPPYPPHPCFPCHVVLTPSHSLSSPFNLAAPVCAPYASLAASAGCKSLNECLLHIAVYEVKHTGLKKNVRVGADETISMPATSLFIATIFDDINIRTSTATILDEHTVQLVAPGNMTLLKANVTVAIAEDETKKDTRSGEEEGEQEEADARGTVKLVVSTDATALYVYLTSTENGYFSENAFVLPGGQGNKTIKFIPTDPPLKPSSLSTASPPSSISSRSCQAWRQRVHASIRIDHVAMYLLP